MKKVLIITYYWPPSGGAGVQRWLKLSKYISRLGVETHVLTIEPDYAAYPVLDKSLLKDIGPEVVIHKSKATNYFSFYEKLVGKKNVPKSGYSNVNAKKFSQRLISSLRSHLFIPDPRKGWNKYAIKKAIEIIEKYEITNVVTTSPPHSTQLIGLELKKQLENINWIVDFRDPWTDIYYYNLLGHSSYSKSVDLNYEKRVLENSDLITTASEGFKTIFLSKKNVKIPQDKIVVMTNGFDLEDFTDNSIESRGNFEVIYTGTISEQYSPNVFFDSFKKIQEEFPNLVKLKIVGSMSPAIMEYAASLNIDYDFISHVPHEEVVLYQQKADLLLLIIPDVEKSNGIIPGKLFEYLASRNPILVIGSKDGDVARIINESEAGKTFNRSEMDQIYKYIKSVILSNKDGGKIKIPMENVTKYMRSQQAVLFEKLLK